MSYLVLARKYRPQTLDELIGQKHIARALSNAVHMDRVAHAYLFCGARGTGKTSTARILAKMLNCETGPTSIPCGTCRPCTEIAAGNSIDVYELDAASNRGVNDIRELREGVGYAPARDRHKIYIVDEAHMLTTEAANAFLKTLEEPPSHAIFILATTDPQRLPITIRSRCQRYDFRRVRAAEVVAALREIVNSEAVELGDDALYLVAREGDGSMRDSLSVLDQVIAFGGDMPRAEEVAALLGVADRNRTAGLIGALLRRDAPKALEAVGAAHNHGIDLRTFARNIAMEARDVLVVRLSAAAAKDLVDRSESELASLRDIAEGVDTTELERLAHVLLEVAEGVAQARHPRLLLEMGVVRLCRAHRLTDVAELASRVEGLLRGGGASSGRRAAQSQPAAAPRRSAQAQPQLRAAASSSAATAAESRPTAAVTPSGLPPRRRIDTSRAPRTATPAAGGEPAEEPSIAGVLSSAAPASSAASASKQPVSGAIRARGRSLCEADLRAWESTLQDELGDPINAVLIAQAVVQRSGPGRVELGFRNQFYANKAKVPENHAQLVASAQRAFAGHYEVFIGGVDDRARTDSLTAHRKAESKRVQASEVAALREDESVQRVISAFDGRISYVVAETEMPDKRES